MTNEERYQVAMDNRIRLELSKSCSTPGCVLGTPHLCGGQHMRQDGSRFELAGVAK
jgi:hypothetical protein